MSVQTPKDEKSGDSVHERELSPEVVVTLHGKG
jgi:hypothetical protein